MQGVVFSKKELEDPKTRKLIGRLLVRTEDNRFFYLKIRKDHSFFTLFDMCEEGMEVEWGGSTHFKILERGTL